MRKDLVMPAKTILSISGVDHSDEDLLAAAEVARQSRAHLNAIVISCVPPPPIRDLVGQTYSTYAFEWEEENNRVSARVADLRELLSQHGFDGDVQPVYCLNESVDEEVAKRAMYADVTLIGTGMLEDGYLLKRVLDGALFESPTPVVLAGKNSKATLAPKAVLVAWNSRLEAGAAVRQSLDMLVNAENVHIVLVDPTAKPYAMGEEPGADVAAFLSRHGVKVTVEVFASGGLDPALVLQRHATDIGAELIVMGAYGHSRMRERLFGGTTQTMLSHVDTPVLMAR
jgi:nucleotide-binding universal stress UspA family protein